MSEHSMPGMEEVGGLVTELENQYTMDSWEARNMFAQARKSSVARVAISEYRRAASPLVQEVRPEDVVVADRRKEWADMDENDYDGNYVASTDPIHPVNTDYSHPWDDDVGSWVLNHLSPEELEAPSPDTIVDLDKSSWSWEDACPPEETKSKPTAMTRKEKNPVIVNDQLMADRDSREDVECLVAWGPEAKATSSTGQINMDDVKREDVRKGRIKEVIDAFWTTVNADLSVEQPRQRPSSPHEDKMSALLNALNI
ncbi:Nn.00g041970.m01.CDS01 [Neocucurbitaria sp. VM-36]